LTKNISSFKIFRKLKIVKISAMKNPKINGSEKITGLANGIPAMSDL